jgi:hypothetical protein
MSLLAQFLPGVLTGAVVSGAVLAIGARFWPRATWAGPVAVGAGYAANHLVGIGWPGFPPLDATLWLFHFALAAMVIGVLDVLVRAPVWLRIGVWLAIGGGLLALLLKPKFQYGWTPREGAVWLSGASVTLVALSCCLQRLAAAGSRSVLMPLVVLMVAAGSTVALILTGSLLLGQLAMGLAAAIGAGVLVGWLIPNDAFRRGVAPVAALLLSGLWLSGYFYSELPASSALMLAAAPGLALVCPSRDVTERKILLLRAGLVVLPVVAAVVMAMRTSPPTY